MKLKAMSDMSEIKEESDNSSSTHSSSQRKSKLHVDHKYRVIQCTGYLKTWNSLKNEDVSDSEDQNANMFCLVAIGKIPNNVLEFNYPVPLDKIPAVRQVIFISRHSVDGKFLFIDQR